MKISLSPINENNYMQTKKAKYYPNLAPLACDTISFKAMKKPEFEGIDLLVVKNYKAPIEKFNSNQDLQNWAQEKANGIIKKDFVSQEVKIDLMRKEILAEWVRFLNAQHKNTTTLYVLNSITKKLKPNNKKLPPMFNEKIANECINEIETNIKKDRSYVPSFLKLYETKLRQEFLDNNYDENQIWVVIPSFSNDSANFQRNIEKLKVLSSDLWCTKTTKAKTYLLDGDFYIYFNQGKPLIGMRTDSDNTIAEIQGILNNDSIPCELVDIIDDFIKNQHLKTSEEAQNEITQTKALKAKLDKIKADLKDDIENKNFENILKYFGIKAQKDKDGLLIIDSYRQPKQCKFSDIGIDEDELLLHIKRITKNANFKNSEAKTLGSVEEILKDAYFSYSIIIYLSKLRTIGGTAIFANSQIQSLGNLEEIKEDAYFQLSQVIDLGKLRFIGGRGIFQNSKIKEINNSIVINGGAFFD